MASGFFNPFSENPYLTSLRTDPRGQGNPALLGTNEYNPGQAEYGPETDYRGFSSPIIPGRQSWGDIYAQQFQPAATAAAYKHQLAMDPLEERALNQKIDLGQRAFDLFAGAFGRLSRRNPDNNTGISVGGVWTPQQIQQQVNQARAHNDAQAASAMANTAGGLAARGYAGTSPLVQALNTQAQMGAMQANTQASTQIPFEAAQANARQQLATESERARNITARQNAVLGLLGSTLGRSLSFSY